VVENGRIGGLGFALWRTKKERKITVFELQETKKRRTNLNLLSRTVGDDRWLGRKEIKMVLGLPCPNHKEGKKEKETHFSGGKRALDRDAPGIFSGREGETKNRTPQAVPSPGGKMHGGERTEGSNTFAGDQPGRE